MAYSTELTSKLSGATTGQLARWRRATSKQPPVLVPEHGQVGGSYFYSFRDLVALRTVVYLRDFTSLQMIREAVGTLEEIGNREHLSAYTLMRVPDERDEARTQGLVWVDGETIISLTDKPRSFMMPMVRMIEVVGKFVVARTERQVPDLYAPSKYVEVDPEVRGGFPMIRGTRVPFDQVAELMDDGLQADEVAKVYPSVSPVAALDAYRWWRTLGGEPKAA